MKKILALLLVLSLFSSLGLNISYADSPSNWAKAEVEDLKKTGHFEEERFSDFQKPITRGQFIYFAARLFEVISGEEIVISKDVAFTDTKDIWALKGASVGITDGLSDGRFGPNQLLTREQLATMLIRTLNLCNLSLNPTDGYKFLDDNQISSWAKEAVYLARANGIIDGMGDGNMAPKKSATVEQCIAIINRVLKNSPIDKSDTSPTGTRTLTRSLTKVSDSTLYYGEIKNNLLDGFGVMTDLEGIPYYIGEFKEGQIHGLGFQFAATQTLMGFFEGGKLNGFGLVVDANKGYMVSTFNNNQVDGLLLQLDPNGEVNGAYYKNGKYVQGITEFFSAKKVDIIEFENGEYLGETKNGLPNGVGVFSIYNDDTRMTYVGEFVNGSFHGQGTLIINYNEVYIGSFQNDKFTGNGFVCYRPYNNGYYIGGMKDFQPDSYGVYIYDNGSIRLGSFSNLDIQDRWIYADLDHFYIGDLKDNSKNGRGISYYSFGGVYIGEYKDSLPDGQGTYIDTQGNLYEGLWLEGEFIGE